MFDHFIHVITTVTSIAFTFVIVCAGSGLLIAALVIISSYFNDRQLKKNVDRRAKDVSRTNKK